MQDLLPRGWVVETVPLTVEIRGPLPEQAWRATLDRFGITARSTQGHFLRDLTRQALEELDRMYGVRSEALRQQHAGPDARRTHDAQPAPGDCQACPRSVTDPLRSTAPSRMRERCSSEGKTVQTFMIGSPWFAWFGLREPMANQNIQTPNHFVISTSLIQTNSLNSKPACKPILCHPNWHAN